MQLACRAGEKGFSLVELLLAVAIMAIALAPIMDSITSSFQSTNAGEENTILVNYAREKMDSILAMPFNQVPAGPVLSDTVTVYGKAVDRDVLVELYDGTGGSIPDINLKKITVTIKGTQLATLMANY